MDGQNKINTLGGFTGTESAQITRKSQAEDARAARSGGSAINVQDSVSASGAGRSVESESRISTLLQVNKASFGSHEASADIAQAQAAVEQEQQILQEIRRKFGSTSAEELLALRESFNKAAADTAAVQNSIAVNDRQRAMAGKSAIKSTDGSLASFEPRQVAFSAPSYPGLDSAEDLDKAISERQALLKQLEKQSRSGKESAAALNQASNKALLEIKNSAAAEGKISSQEEAEKVAAEVAGAVRETGAPAVEAFNPRRSTQQSVASLLA